MMRYFIVLAATVFLLCLFSVTTASASDKSIPTSAKSESVYRRVAPKLISEMLKKGLNLGDPVFIRIFKLDKELEVWIRTGLTYKLFKTYSICDLSGKLGPKLKEGDKQSPEGFYTVGSSQLNPHSDYHLAFNLGFPNEYDRSHKRTGSLLMVHGRCSSAGCYAMTDYRMEEIYAIAESAIILGQQQIPVHIFPFRMTSKNMKAFQDSPWIDFWRNLKEGYDHFEGNRFPPLVTVEDKNYQFMTFRPLLFGGNFGDRTGSSDLAEYRKTGRTTKPRIQMTLTARVTPAPEEKRPKRERNSAYYEKLQENSSYL